MPKDIMPCQYHGLWIEINRHYAMSISWPLDWDANRHYAMSISWPLDWDANRHYAMSISWPLDWDANKIRWLAYNNPTCKCTTPVSWHLDWDAKKLRLLAYNNPTCKYTTPILWLLDWDANKIRLWANNNSQIGKICHINFMAFQLRCRQKKRSLLSPSTKPLGEKYATSYLMSLYWDANKSKVSCVEPTNWHTPHQSHGLWIWDANTISYNEPIGIRHVNLMAFGFEMPIQSPMTNQLAYATSISRPLDLRCQYNLLQWTNWHRPCQSHGLWI